MLFKIISVVLAIALVAVGVIFANDHYAMTKRIDSMTERLSANAEEIGILNETVEIYAYEIEALNAENTQLRTQLAQ